MRLPAGSRRFAEYALFLVGIVALGYCLWVYVSARLFQASATRQLASATRQFTQKALPAAPAIPASPAAPATKIPAAPATKDGAPLCRLEIPRLHVAVMVVEGDGDGDLERAAGHIPGTALPGEPGNVGIAAHRDTFFRPLRNIRPNDTIIVNTARGTFDYRVVSTEIVRPDDVQVLSPTARDSLTLVTCYPFYYIGAAPKRFIVRAERQSS